MTARWALDGEIQSAGGVLYDDGGTHDGALAVSAEDCAVDGARQLKVGEPYK